MLRNSMSPASGLSNRPSPPITRSVSRLAQIAFRNAPIDQSTPKHSRINRKEHIQTVERHHEVADDDDEELEEEFDEFGDRVTRNNPNDSKFIYKEHFTVKERFEMYYAEAADWSNYTWRILRRRFCPSWKTFRELIIAVIMISIMVKYIQENFYSHVIHNDGVELKRQVERQIEGLGRKISELQERQKLLNIHLDDVQKLHNHKDDSQDTTEEVRQRIEILEKKIGDLRSDVENVRIDNKMDLEGQVEQIKRMKYEVAPSETRQTTETVGETFRGINAANSLIGATIDEKCSSRTVTGKDSVILDLMSYVVPLKNGYVILDRDNLQPGDAWCTYDNRATLTIKLGRWIQPHSVSYQHVKWSGIVPNNAPKLYDVVACRSECCTQFDTLISKCEYGLEHGNIQEQFCEVQNNQKQQPTNHVQFRFRENQGNMTKTCAYLVRVYGEVVDPPIVTSLDTVAQESQEKQEAGGEKNVISEYLSSIPYLYAQ